MAKEITQDKEEQVHQFIQNFNEMTSVATRVKDCLENLGISRAILKTYDKNSLEYGLYRQAIKDGITGLHDDQVKDAVVDQLADSSTEIGKMLDDKLAQEVAPAKDKKTEAEKFDERKMGGTIGDGGGFVGEKPEQEHVDAKANLYEKFMDMDVEFTIDNFREFCTQQLSKTQFETDGERIINNAVTQQIEKGDRQKLMEENPCAYEAWLLPILRNDKAEPVNNTEYYLATQEFGFVKGIFYQVELDDKGEPAKIDFKIKATSNSPEPVTFRTIDSREENSLAIIDQKEFAKTQHRSDQAFGSHLSHTPDVSREKISNLNEEGRGKEQLKTILSMLGYQEEKGKGQATQLTQITEQKMDLVKQMVYMLRHQRGIQQEKEGENAQSLEAEHAKK